MKLFKRHKRKKTRVKTLNTIVRLEPFRREPLKNLRRKPEIDIIKAKILKNSQKDKRYENKNNVDSRAYKRYIQSDSKVCDRREQRRKEIMRLTRGRGMSVKNTQWNLDSFKICRR